LAKKLPEKYDVTKQEIIERIEEMEKAFNEKYVEDLVSHNNVPGELQASSVRGAEERAKIPSQAKD